MARSRISRFLGAVFSLPFSLFRRGSTDSDETEHDSGGIKDRLVLGAISGMLAQLGRLPLSMAFVIPGIVKWGDINVAAGFFMLPSQVKTTVGGWVLGFVTTLVVTGILGSILAYVFTFTGSDYWLIKGAGFGAAAWLTFWGLLLNLRAGNVVPMGYLNNIVSFILQIIWGALTAWLITRLGNKELFDGRRGFD